MLKHFFFDLDNTLTRSKSHIAPEHKPILNNLIAHADVIVVSGHGASDIRAHLEEVSGYHTLGQNGNKAETADGRVLWDRRLTDAQKEAIHAFIAKARAHLALSVRNENDIIEDRGAQIAFSLIGHHEDTPKKEAFDPGGKKRRALIRDLSADVERLAQEYGIEMTIGGTTNIDIYQLGKHKGYNVAAYIEAMGWKKEDCIYLGDALFPGGNDETVVGVIPTKAVQDYQETYRYLSEILARV